MAIIVCYANKLKKVASLYEPCCHNIFDQVFELPYNHFLSEKDKLSMSGQEAAYTCEPSRLLHGIEGQVCNQNNKALSYKIYICKATLMH